MGKMNWSRPPKLREGDYEEKYDAGTVMRNGRVVAGSPQGSLAARAARAEKEWLGVRAKAAAEQRARRRKQKKPPTRAELARVKAIRSQLGLVED